jgi:hypothetical protein
MTLRMAGDSEQERLPLERHQLQLREGCTYCDRGPDQGLPSGSVWLVGNPGTVPMIADGSLESRQR